MRFPPLFAALAALPALALGGCGNLLGADTAAPAVYRLEAASAGDGAPRPTGDWQLSIERPMASAALSSSRIAIARPDGRLEFAAETVWEDRAPLLVQRLMLESFEDAGLGARVAKDSEGIRADFALKSDLSAFEARLGGGAPRAGIGRPAPCPHPGLRGRGGNGHGRAQIVDARAHRRPWRR